MGEYRVLQRISVIASSRGVEISGDDVSQTWERSSWETGRCKLKPKEGWVVSSEGRRTPG